MEPLPQSSPPPPAASRKRKRTEKVASSPAPSELGTPEVLSSRTDLFSRPQLSVSRGPFFIPISDRSSSFFKTDPVGINRVGFRYSPAGIKSPGCYYPFRTIESNPLSYRVSWEDRSPFLYVTKDGLGLSGTKGFRSARCNAPVREGSWYMEVKIVRGGGDASTEGHREGCHVRLGWGRREAPLNGPVGLDGYSYGYRDKTGDKVTLSRPRPYGRPFESGDVIGLYISLPSLRKPNKKDPHDPAHLKRERIAIDLKGQEVFEIQEYPQSKEMIALMDYSGKSSNTASLPSVSNKKAGAGKLPERGPAVPTRTNTDNLRPLPTLSNSHIAFFVNGECQGIAFQDLYDFLQLRSPEVSRKAKEKKRARGGVKEHKENPFDDGTLGYYPFISLFNDACVQLNPGPNFDFPPPPDIEPLLVNPAAIIPEDQKPTWRPICERYAEFMEEQWQLDEFDEEEAKEEFARSDAQERAAAEKQAQRQKKKQQAEARKRAKMQPKERSPTVGDDDRTSYAGAQPSPLRHATTAPEESGDPDDERLVYGGAQPSPLRHTTAAYEPDESPAPIGLEEDSLVYGGAQPSPLRHTADYELEPSPASIGPDEDRLVYDGAQPSPLRQATAVYEPEQSPAPAFGTPNAQSGYTSENGEMDAEDSSTHMQLVDNLDYMHQCED
ncbi:hypothetical protein D9758_003278 [Tetrapyrgos nigripes]|uniref:B30.2/SPRY domain-containing protein n=1 Tax=Tetrapyrgos nigripes TaxID=182062 RepID=A0A8H5GIV9_9AGAR|nr:hypothetical protein D9758_003278 [Tetrapyrgos nigripes]